MTQGQLGVGKQLGKNSIKSSCITKGFAKVSDKEEVLRRSIHRPVMSRTIQGKSKSVLIS